MRIWARRNHIGWIHLWIRRDDFEAGEASAHFFNGRVDPLWLATSLPPGIVLALGRGDLVEIDDPGYFSSDEGMGAE